MTGETVGRVDDGGGGGGVRRRSLGGMLIPRTEIADMPIYDEVV